MNVIAPISDGVVIVLGVIITVLAIQCALWEEHECLARPKECWALSPMLFDLYRALSVAGATSVCVGVANLGFWVLHLPGMTHGVSWSFKFGVLFFLWVRWRYYRDREGHGFLRNIDTAGARSARKGFRQQ